MTIIKSGIRCDKCNEFLEFDTNKKVFLKHECNDILLRLETFSEKEGWDKI